MAESKTRKHSFFKRLSLSSSSPTLADPAQPPTAPRIGGYAYAADPYASPPRDPHPRANGFAGPAYDAQPPSSHGLPPGAAPSSFRGSGYMNPPSTSYNWDDSDPMPSRTPIAAAFARSQSSFGSSSSYSQPSNNQSYPQPQPSYASPSYTQPSPPPTETNPYRNVRPQAQSQQPPPTSRNGSATRESARYSNTLMDAPPMVDFSKPPDLSISTDLPPARSSSRVTPTSTQAPSAFYYQMNGDANSTRPVQSSRPAPTASTAPLRPRPSEEDMSEARMYARAMAGQATAGRSTPAMAAGRVTPASPPARTAPTSPPVSNKPVDLDRRASSRPLPRPPSVSLSPQRAAPIQEARGANGSAQDKSRPRIQIPKSSAAMEEIIHHSPSSPSSRTSSRAPITSPVVPIVQPQPRPANPTPQLHVPRNTERTPSPSVRSQSSASPLAIPQSHVSASPGRSSRNLTPPRMSAEVLHPSRSSPRSPLSQGDIASPLHGIASRQSPSPMKNAAPAPPLVMPRVSSSSSAHASAVRRERSPALPAIPTHPSIGSLASQAEISELGLRVLEERNVQASLFRHLNINTFLALSSSSEAAKNALLPDVVGTWVLREWGLSVNPQSVRAWPSVNVWEGLLESLLHDPASYSGYEAKWYPLLRHLSVSYSLIVLFLRDLPPSAFPNPPPLPFDDDSTAAYSQSLNGMAGLQVSGKRSGFDNGSIAPSRAPPAQERMLEIVMPEPLASRVDQPDDDVTINGHAVNPQGKPRRGSIGSISSAVSFFGRKRSNSASTSRTSGPLTAGPVPSGKAALPPVSFPAARRYGFKRHGDAASSTRSRSSMGSRPGSVFSVQSSPATGIMASPSGIPPVPSLAHGIGAHNRVSTASSDVRSLQSPIGGRFGSPVRRDYHTPPPRAEPAFDKPVPFVPGRVPILRVFIPISDQVQFWPSPQGTAAAVAELRKSGALRSMRLGDLVVNTACKSPKTTEHVLIYVPALQERLIPLGYRYNPAGHLPACLDAFQLPPSYYHPLLNAPQIIYLDLRPYAQRAIPQLRLSSERSDVTIASGAKMVAKRYLHTAGFEITAMDPAASEWSGMISLEAEGTAEGKADLIKRFGCLSPWEVVRERSMSGFVWLRAIDARSLMNRGLQ